MTNMRILPFGPILVQTEVDQNELQVLRENSLKIKDNINYKLAGCCEEQVSFTDEANEAMWAIIKPRIIEYLTAVGQIKFENDLHFDVKLDAVWAVNQKAGEFNPLHDHSSDVSFVVYLDIPSAIYGEGSNGHTGIPAGAIEFIYGKDVQGYRIDHFLNPINSYIKMPEDGMMFIFPSSLFHHVNRFKSDVTRICLAGNVKIIDVYNDKKKLTN